MPFTGLVDTFLAPSHASGAMTQTRKPAEFVIRLEGTFDANTAWNLRGKIVEAPRDSRVVLDFSHVREFYDLGLAVMAYGLTTGDAPPVEMRGLRQHQHRMLRYFGVDPDALGRSSDAGARS